MHGVGSAAPSISESEQARGTHVSSSEKFSKERGCRSEGQKAEGRSENGGTGAPRWHCSHSPRQSAECLPCSNAGAICGFSQQRPRKTSRAVV